ncbi:hypothetical protein PY365_12680 [Roseiarcaceae bacterium H3SJ34-1]|uniref:hypothetical protein n=1 Tax=Terripilifer ovatus TaxID=3032367 RepID=UPI003AB93BB0|nr:hypothetical protein [Roseiarcaceae bacterium H3SJ34-1]
MPASFAKILEGFECAEGGNGTAEAFVCRQTGKVYVRFDFDLTGMIDEELPEDLDDAEKYLPIPDKRDLGLGKPLALDFARECVPDDFEEVRDIFGRSGAYKRFRAFLIRRRVLDHWYDFEVKTTERALREWCTVNDIGIAD